MLLASLFWRKNNDNDVFDINLDCDEEYEKTSVFDSDNDCYYDSDDVEYDAHTISKKDVNEKQNTKPVSDNTKNKISSILSYMSVGNIGNILTDIEEKEDLEQLPPDPFADMNDIVSAQNQEQPAKQNISQQKANVQNTPEQDDNTQNIGDIEKELLHPTTEEENGRVTASSVIALHYYYANNCNWLHALKAALKEIPALCLAFPNSPTNYHPLSAADDTARYLGYNDYKHIASTAESQTSISRALTRFAEETGAWGYRYWFQNMEPSDIDLRSYVEAIRNDIRGLWPMAKINADQFAKMLTITEEDENATVEVGFKTLEDGSRVRILGVNDVSDRWNPESLITQPEENWKAAQAITEAIDVSVSTFDDTADISNQEKLEKLVSLIYLQCYQWSGRSWNKAVEETKRLCESICTYVWASISSEFSLPDLETTRARIERMDELAGELKDDNGNIELRTMVGADGQTYLDVLSAEFKELYDEQKRVEAEYSVQMIVESLVGAMMSPKGNVLILAEDFILQNAINGEDGKSNTEQEQLLAVEKVKDDMLKLIDSKSKTYKSQWKKYFGNHKDDAEKIKENCIIIGFEDGKIVFA